MDPSCPAQSLVGPLDLYVPVAISHTQIFLSQDDVANFLSSLVISQFDTMLICPLENNTFSMYRYRVFLWYLDNVSEVLLCHYKRVDCTIVSLEKSGI